MKTKLEEEEKMYQQYIHHLKIIFVNFISFLPQINYVFFIVNVILSEINIWSELDE